MSSMWNTLASERAKKELGRLPTDEELEEYIDKIIAEYGEEYE